MTLVVHVVGLADLGIKKSGSLPREVAEHRLRHLESLDSATRFISAFFDNNYPHPPQVSNTDHLEKVISKLPCPLTKAFQSLKAHNTTDIQLLIIGSQAGETPTAPLAKAIHGALNRWLSDISTHFGITLTLSPVCTLESLNEENSFTTLENALSQAASQEVVLPVGGGANALVVTVAGTLNHLFPSSWRYIDLKSGGLLEAEFTDAPADPLKGWLLGLGLPTVAKEFYPNDSAIDEAAHVINIACGEEPPGNNASSLADALGFLTLLDVARGDLAAGMSTRAWMDHSPNRVRNASYFKRAGIEATHRFTPTLLNQPLLVEEIHKVLNGLQPDWLSWPNEHACLLYAQGLSTPSAEALRNRPPLPVSLMSEEPPSAVDLNFGTPRQRRLSVIVAASPDTTTLAELTGSYMEGDESSAHRHPAWTFTEEDYHLLPYGSLTSDCSTDNADEIRRKMKDLYVQASEELERLFPRPRVLIVGTTGEKPPMMTLLAAAQEFGAKYGIPVFLTSLVRDDKQDERLQFHQFGLAPRSREALLAAASYCMDRFDFYAVARILAIGDSQMWVHAPQAVRLADSLITAVRTADIDAHAATILDVLSAVSDRFTSGRLPHDAQQRLATIVGELVTEKMGVRPSRTRFFMVYGRGMAVRGPADQLNHEQLLSLLRKVRNQITINHGATGVDGSLVEAVENIQFPGAAWTYPELLQRAIEQTRIVASCPNSDDPNSWYQQYQELRSAINQMRQEASTTPLES